MFFFCLSYWFYLESCLYRTKYLNLESFIPPFIIDWAVCVMFFELKIFFWEKVSCNFKICLNWKTSGFRSSRDDHLVHGLLAVRAVRALQSNLLPLPHLRHRPHVQGHLQYHPRGSNGKFKFHVFDEWMNYVSN